jgi:VIT1/CCC1 family predicted Fe2+/Mn2+ transporter
MNTLIERGHAFTVLKKITGSENDEVTRGIIRGEIQPLLSALLKNDELDQLSARLKQLPAPTKKHLLTSSDFIVAVQIFLLVFLCTFPVALPFAIFHEVGFALRASNGVALFLLFVAGYKLAGYAGFRPFFTALIYTAIGALLVSLTIALGG